MFVHWPTGFTTMSASPPPDVDAEKQGSVDQGDDTGLPGGAQEMGGFYEMDVKEQDRWLPIANGELCFFP